MFMIWSRILKITLMDGNPACAAHTESGEGIAVWLQIGDTDHLLKES